MGAICVTQTASNVLALGVLLCIAVIVAGFVTSYRRGYSAGIRSWGRFQGSSRRRGSDA